MERGSSISYRKEVKTSQNRTHVPNTYSGKIPWLGHNGEGSKEREKSERETVEFRSIIPQLNMTIGKEAKLMKKKSPSLNMKEETGKLAKEIPLIQDDMSTDDLNYESEPSLDLVCNVALVLLVEYHC